MILAAAGDFGVSFLLEILGLLIVVAIIWRYVVPPLNRQMNRRLSVINSQLLAGEEARAASLRLVEERRAALEQAKGEAVEIVEQAKKSAQLLLDDGLSRSEADYERIVTRIASEIESSKIRAREAVMSELGAVVVRATETVVRAVLDEELQDRLLEQAIEATEGSSEEAML